MILNVYIDEQQIPINIPDRIMQEAREFYDKMDADMDKGWQMGRQWVEKPDALQRCQIVANKLVSAIENENQNMSMMMAGYLMFKNPAITGVNILTDGEMQDTEILTD